jgi:cytochrome c peroxidase
MDRRLPSRPRRIGAGLRARAAALAATLTLASGCPSGAQSPGATAAPDGAAAIVPLEVPPWVRPGSAAEIALGGRLFADPRLSRSGKIACDSCHDLNAAGADPYARSPGLDGKPLRRNTPTIFNAALSFALGWTGAFDSLEAATSAAIESPETIGPDWDQVVAGLAADPDYRRGFSAAYGTEPTRAGVVSALAAFERTLVTPGSRFDRYLEGDKTILTPAEVAGYELFERIGCVSCHQGRSVGGNLFVRFGVFEAPGGINRGGSDDPGRQEVTGRPSDRHVFRVPSLRNVAVTPPYFHDGSAATLTQAVTVMARSQLGRSLEPGDVDLVVQFLGTLTGSYDGRQLTASPPVPPPR